MTTQTNDVTTANVADEAMNMIRNVMGTEIGVGGSIAGRQFHVVSNVGEIAGAAGFVALGFWLAQ